MHKKLTTILTRPPSNSGAGDATPASSAVHDLTQPPSSPQPGPSHARGYPRPPVAPRHGGPRHTQSQSRSQEQSPTNTQQRRMPPRRWSSPVPRGRAGSPYIVVDGDDANSSVGDPGRHSAPPALYYVPPTTPSPRPRLFYDQRQATGQRYANWDPLPGWPQVPGNWGNGMGIWQNGSGTWRHMEFRDTQVNFTNRAPFRPSAINSCYISHTTSHTTSDTTYAPRYGSPYGGGCCVFNNRPPMPMGPPLAHHNIAVQPLAPYAFPSPYPYFMNVTHPPPRPQYTPQTYMMPYPPLSVNACTMPTYSYTRAIPVAQPQVPGDPNQQYLILGYLPDGCFGPMVISPQPVATQFENYDTGSSGEQDMSLESVEEAQDQEEDQEEEDQP